MSDTDMARLAGPPAPKGEHTRYEQSDVLSLMHVFEPPPDGFQPHTANAALLRRHGFPRRPDPEQEPRLAQLWHRALSRPTRFTRAELAIDPVMSQRNPLHRAAAANGQDDFRPGGWGGVVVETASLGLSPAEPAKTGFGQWAVPGIWPASDPSGPITAGFWVGLDGFTNGQVLQAGSCSAGTQHNTFDLTPDGIITNIGGSSAALTQASIASPTTAVVEWTGWT